MHANVITEHDDKSYNRYELSLYAYDAYTT